MSKLRIVVVFCAALGIALPSLATTLAAPALPPDWEPQGKRQVLFIIDGLRPDMVTAETTPRLHALREGGVWFTRHHAAFPTVTRVNAATLATGAHPGSHGLVDNRIYVPEVEADTPLDTADHTALQRVQAADPQGLLHVPTLAEQLASADKAYWAVSSGSPGSAFLLNPRAASFGVLNRAFSLPAERHAAITQTLGALPAADYPNTPRVRWVVDAYLAQPEAQTHGSHVTVFWFTDPDHTAHACEIGHPKTAAALQGVDTQLGRLVDHFERGPYGGKTNYLVTSDHGFSSMVGRENPLSTLFRIAQKLRRPPTDFILAGFGMHLRNLDASHLPAVIEALHRSDWVGAIFTRAADERATEGGVPGTLPLRLAHLHHPRAGDVVVVPRWSDAKNDYGVAGVTYVPGAAGHGSSSPFDIQTACIGHGPDFKAGYTGALPTHNVDLTATLAVLAGVPLWNALQGRVLAEGLRGGPDADRSLVSQRTYEAAKDYDDGFGYRTVLTEHLVGPYRYFTQTATTRKLP